jgi:putative Holliday junction resolvase
VRVLGIDLGSKRVGVAVSDRSGTIATPLCVLERGASQRVDHSEIARLVHEEEAVAIVVGLPLNMDGTAGKAAEAALREVERMTTVVGVPVYVHDERLTTVEADRVLMEQKMRAQARRRVVDKVAAAVILQSWLDGQTSHSQGVNQS